MDTLSILIGAHAVSMECPSLDILVAAYARTFGNPWGPLHCYTVSNSTGSTDGQNLKARKANISLLSGILMQGFHVTIENCWPIICRTCLVYSLRLSWGGIGIQQLFILCHTASILILNCGMQSVTTICLSSHISFRLTEIKILIGVISQGEEVNRWIGIGVLYGFKLHVQFCP